MNSSLTDIQSNRRTFNRCHNTITRFTTLIEFKISFTFILSNISSDITSIVKHEVITSIVVVCIYTLCFYDKSIIIKTDITSNTYTLSTIKVVIHECVTLFQIEDSILYIFIIDINILKSCGQ